MLSDATVNDNSNCYWLPSAMCLGGYSLWGCKRVGHDLVTK